MSVEIHEETMMASHNDNSSSSVSNDQCSPGIAKGKRTKRQRQLLQSPGQAAPSSSTSSSYSGSTTEEEDMANCLILLAQGRALDAHPKPRPEEEEAVVSGSGERFTSRRLAEAATTTNGKVGFYVYECKTCSKCFPSFQALGGHRASHKKPKTAPVAAVMAMEANKPAREDVLPIRSIAPYPNPSDVLPNYHTGGKAAAPSPMINSSSVSTAIGNNNKTRVHECSICGSEFSSGQALGGHMRRHRAVVAVAEPLPEAKKEKNILCLDLNLPAPMEDERGDPPKAPPFPFPAKQPLIFSASPLVDCHY
ncbi:hypothetical protein Taro_030567 [Colocasia esculenta]|uniref:C2H2-type domain-containing protein n=1 Tax=Colocasia esculenta TaxID=4460 RepID=A0A843VPI6_COLES|nr:hypothetical protein [Colocasia esculenta]